MFAILLMAVILSAEPPAGGETFEWRQIEQQIEWHRQRVRACGPLSAVYALQLLGHHVDAAQVLTRTQPVNDDGVPLAEVLRLCRELEPRARLVQLPNKTWRRLECPCILVVNERQHALVLRSYSHRRQTATVWDPADLKIKSLPLPQLEAVWTGDAILLHGFPWTSIVLGAANLLMLSALLVAPWRRRNRRRKADHD
jgi:hypothetical protein